MSRFITLLTAALIATPSIAGTYSAKPATAPAQSKIIARDIAWNCADGACQGKTEESRPLVLCQGLVKRTGRLDSFVANGRAFGATELAQCNASAKDSGGAVATAN